MMQNNGVIICVNLRGLWDNYMPAELAEIRRQDIYKNQGDNSDFLKSAVTIKNRIFISLRQDLNIS